MDRIYARPVTTNLEKKLQRYQAMVETAEVMTRLDIDMLVIDLILAGSPAEYVIERLTGTRW